LAGFAFDSKIMSWR